MAIWPDAPLSVARLEQGTARLFGPPEQVLTTAADARSSVCRLQRAPQRVQGEILSKNYGDESLWAKERVRVERSSQKPVKVRRDDTGVLVVSLTVILHKKPG